MAAFLPFPSWINTPRYLVPEGLIAKCERVASLKSHQFDIAYSVLFCPISRWNNIWSGKCYSCFLQNLGLAEVDVKHASLKAASLCPPLFPLQICLLKQDQAKVEESYSFEWISRFFSLIITANHSIWQKQWEYFEMEVIRIFSLLWITRTMAPVSQLHGVEHSGMVWVKSKFA